MIQEKSLKKNAFFNVINTLMKLLFPLITFPYASRILLPDGIGKVNFANSVISYFALIASLGIGTYGIRESAKIRNNKEEFSQFFIEIFTINIISTIISYLLLFLALHFIPKFAVYKSLIIICSTSIFFTTIGVDWILSSLEEYGFITIRSVFFQFISLILLFIFIKTKDDYVKYAFISVFSSVGSNICNLLHIKKFLSFKQIKKLNLKKHLKPIFILFGSSIAISIFTMLDTVMLGFLSNDSEVGYYSAATKIIRMIRDLFPAVFLVLYARMSIIADNKAIDRLKSLTEKTLSFIMCLSFPIISGLFVLAEQIILIISGEYYLPALNAMYSMIPLIFLSSTSGFLGGTVLNSLGKEKQYLYCVITGAISDFILNLILIPKYGSFGAGIATLFTEFILFILYIALNHKLIFTKKLFTSFFKYIFATIIMTFTCILIMNLFYTPITKLVFTTVTGVIIYFVMLILLKDDLLKSIITSIKDKFILKHSMKS